MNDVFGARQRVTDQGKGCQPAHPEKQGLLSRARAVLWIGAVLVAMVGASRIYLGAHWLTDVSLASA